MKKLTKIATISTLALATIFAVPSLQSDVFASSPAMVSTQQQETTLATTGTASRQVAPDYAVLNLGIVTKADTVSVAKSENDHIMNNLIAKLLGQGITQNNLTTLNFSVSPNYVYSDNNDSKLKGYTIRNTISVKINDLNQISNVFDLAAKCGINEIDSLSFYNNQQQSVEDQLTGEAVRNARHRADVMAAALGLKVAAVKEATVNQVRTIQDNRSSYLQAMSSSTPVENGTLALEKTVYITYLLTK